MGGWEGAEGRGGESPTHKKWLTVKKQSISIMQLFKYIRSLILYIHYLASDSYKRQTECNELPAHAQFAPSLKWPCSKTIKCLGRSFLYKYFGLFIML